MEKIPIGISSCLLGEKVRYDGGHKRNSYVCSTLNQYFDFYPYCPEMAIGMGVPRIPIQLIQQQDAIRAVQITASPHDVTEQLRLSALHQKHVHKQLCGYILKKDSPSCGMERVKVYSNSIPTRKGIGIFAAQLQVNNPLLPIEEEGRLNDPVLRENFIQRIYTLHRWKQLVEQGITAKKLIDFHAQHKLIIMSRGDYRPLGTILANLSQDDITSVAERYILQLMTVLNKVATRKRHVNVLEHIQGYLKTRLDRGDKAELSMTIKQYRFGEIPLIVPLRLLKHHFRKCPDPYIENSFYLAPYPEQLQLINQL